MAISSQTTCCIFVLHNFIRTISNSCKTTIIRARTTTRQPTPPTTRLASSVVRLPKLRQQKLPKRRLSLRRGYQPDGYEFVEEILEEQQHIFFEKNFLQGRQSKSARSEYIASQVLSFEKKLLRHHVTTVFAVVGGFRSYSPWSCLELSTMEISLVKFE